MQPELLLEYDFAVRRGEYTVRALLRLTGRPPQTDSRTPLNLSLVLDRSGSMTGAKLHAAREAAVLAVHRLHPEDTVSVVAYDDQVVTVAEPGTAAQQNGVSDAIRAIGSGGTTNLSGGWLRGRELIARHLQPGAVNRVLLMTDGRANVGITDVVRLRGLCAEAREAGVTTTTIGFGTDYDEHLLRKMADAGGGHTYYIEQIEQAAAVFQEELEGLLTLSAQNVTVEIRPAGAASFTRIHHSYPSAETAGGLRVELGDLYAREPRRLLMEFVVPNLPDASDVSIAEVRVSADVLTEAGGVERQEVVLPVRTGLSPDGHQEPEVHREVLLQEAARVRQEALNDRRRGDYGAGERRLRETAAQLSLMDDTTCRAEAEDLERMAGTFATRQVTEMDAKYLHQRAYDVSRSKMASVQAYERRPRRPGRIRYLRGDATQPQGTGQKLVAHAVDLTGVWGPGFARALSARWPDVEAAYRHWIARGVSPDGAALEPGAISFIPVAAEVTVALLAARRPATAGQPPRIDYAALDEALRALGDEAIRSGSSVHMPRIGNAIGGAQWHTVEQMVEQRLCDRGVPVTVYTL